MKTNTYITNSEHRTNDYIKLQYIQVCIYNNEIVIIYNLILTIYYLLKVQEHCVKVNVNFYVIIYSLNSQKRTR